MAWDFRDDQPIYAQLVDRLKRAVAAGEYPPGGKLPSVRELASNAGINPNTVQRAFGELERDGLVITQRTSGKFVTDSAEQIESVKKQLAESEIHHFIVSMRTLGYDLAQAQSMLAASTEGESQHANS
jgi:GntR family transcriptional regulator